MTGSMDFADMSPENLRILLAIQSRLLKAGSDLDATMQVAVNSICEMLGFEGSVIELKEADKLVYHATSGESVRDAIGTKIDIEKSLSGQCLLQGRSLTCLDTETCEYVDREACRRLNIRSMTVYPLRTTGSAVGVLKVLSSRPNADFETYRPLLEHLADYLAKNLEDAKIAEVSNRRFESLANALPALVWIADTKGNIRWCNEQWYEYTGMTREQMANDGWDSAHDPEELPRVRREWLEGRKSCAKVEMIYPLRGGDGRYRWFLTRVNPLKDRSGEIVSWFGTSIDIDSQLQIESELRESRARYESLTQAIPQLIWTGRDDGGCDFVSRQWCNYTGLEASELLGDGWLSAVHPDDRAETAARWKAAVNGLADYDTEYRLRRANGEYRWFKVRGVRVRGGEALTSHWVGTSTDVHEERMASEEIAKARDAAEKANDLKTAFLANMSHEIRTPLGAILGFADLLADPTLSETDRARYIGILHRNGEQLGRIINDILDLSKVETGLIDLEYRQVNAAEVGREVTSFLSVLARDKGLKLEFKHLEEASAVVSDSGRMKQVLMNLVNNAIKFTPCGKVTVEFSRHPSIPDLYHFDVIDTGNGIKGDSIERLFKVFSQADNSMTRKYGGTGLGLALSRSLARAMGGDVMLVETVPDKGSRFRFSFRSLTERLPANTSADEAARSENATAIGKEALSGVNVLLVEDSPDNQQLIERYLSRCGAHIDIASNGVEGLRLAADGKHDIVLIDLQMPVMNGYTAVEKLRARGYEKPIVALTAHAMSDVKKKCVEVGCSGHLPKPINPRDLVASIRSLL